MSITKKHNELILKDLLEAEKKITDIILELDKKHSIGVTFRRPTRDEWEQTKTQIKLSFTQCVDLQFPAACRNVGISPEDYY